MVSKKQDMIMIGFAIGLFCGLGELYILFKLVKAITDKSGQPLFVYFVFKFLLLAAALSAVALIIPKQLALAGAGIATALVGGAVIYYIRNLKGGK